MYWWIHSNVDVMKWFFRNWALQRRSVTHAADQQVHRKGPVIFFRVLLSQGGNINIMLRAFLIFRFRYKNIIQLWTGCAAPGVWFGEERLVIIWGTDVVSPRSLFLSLFLSLCLSVCSQSDWEKKCLFYSFLPHPPQPRPTLTSPVPFLHHIADSTVGPLMS